MSVRRDDVLILGAGVIGLYCALELLRTGRGVTVIDAGRVGGGSSHGNCGTITPSHATPLAAPGMIGKALRWMLQPDAPFYVRPRWDPALAHWLLRFAGRCNRRDYRASTEAKSALLRDSRLRLERTIRAEALECEFEASGLTYVYREGRNLEAALALVADLGAAGVRAQALDGAELARREPALRTGMAGGVYFPDDAVLRPDRFVAELARVVRAQGGVIHEQVRATDFLRAADGRIAAVQTDSGARPADEVVIACGAWSPALVRALGLPLPIQPGKGYSMTFSRPALAPRAPLVLRERSVCVTVWGSGFRLGSTMEFSGYDAGLNRVRLEALRRGAAEYLREPEGAELREEWCGWRPMTWDDLPLIGRPVGIPNAMLAVGHGMLGMSMAAGTAALVSELMQQRAPSLDPAPYSPRRFGV